jgi:hypothetical protein
VTPLPAIIAAADAANELARFLTENELHLDEAEDEARRATDLAVQALERAQATTQREPRAAIPDARRSRRAR